MSLAGLLAIAVGLVAVGVVVVGTLAVLMVLVRISAELLRWGLQYARLWREFFAFVAKRAEARRRARICRPVLDEHEGGR